MCQCNSLEVLTEQNLPAMLNQLSKFHHEEKNCCFDHLYMKLIGFCEKRVVHKILARKIVRSAHELCAQNSIARRNFAAAKKACDLARHHARIVNKSEDSMPRINMLDAEILHRTASLPDPVIAYLKRAYKGFVSECNLDGQAEALRELAYQFARQRKFTEAHLYLDKATEIFQRVGNIGAVYVTVGTRAGVHQMQGNKGVARGLLVKSLNYWKKKKHVRWTTYFIQKIQLLDNNKA